ncbi:hypothetical protein [Yersinia phage fHe-Yen9-04]|uniref:Uncharacterized protein n=2 Tax=Eneladusvirus Yen904 TaxID=2560849 RepID=A0A2C9CXD3_9CAUD|nr:virion structural protein [Yersinia phage fHe-Yen9-04]SOK58569.1 hypothetical protein [Yersinia phage fHe-Yen9-04]SOK59105.1 hypothetical protein [Yersinia phage fHe-Yen9-03]VUE36338.1 hypothetical protein [Yersinia phage fHe-Yen9-04]
MRFNQITEDAPGKDIRNMISTIALSLIATGREQISIQSLINEIKKRTNIDVPYNVMMDILNELPFVQDANSDMVNLQGTDTSPDGDSIESPEEQVTDMATKAASANLKQDI